MLHRVHSESDCRGCSAGWALPTDIGAQLIRNGAEIRGKPDDFERAVTNRAGAAFLAGSAPGRGRPRVRQSCDDGRQAKLPCTELRLDTPGGRPDDHTTRRTRTASDPPDGLACGRRAGGRRRRRGDCPQLARGEGADQAESAAAAKGRLQQSVCRWCYAKIPLDDLCCGGQADGPGRHRPAQAEGFRHAQEVRPDLHHDQLAPPGQRPVRPEVPRQPAWRRSTRRSRPRPRRAGRTSSASRATPAASTARPAWRTASRPSRRSCPSAEKAGVVLQMELLNSKVNHKDYMCDNSTWGVELVKRVGSGHFKLLYDIYHMQIMEGDVIRTIEANHDYYRPLPHRRQPRPARDRRHPGAELPGDRPGHRRPRLPGLRRPRVPPHARPADQPGRGGHAVPRLSALCVGPASASVGAGSATFSFLVGLLVAGWIPVPSGPPWLGTSPRSPTAPHGSGSGGSGSGHRPTGAD